MERIIELVFSKNSRMLLIEHYFDTYFAAAAMAVNMQFIIPVLVLFRLAKIRRRRMEI